MRSACVRELKETHIGAESQTKLLLHLHELTTQRVQHRFLISQQKHKLFRRLLLTACRRLLILELPLQLRNVCLQLELAKRRLPRAQGVAAFAPPVHVRQQRTSTLAACSRRPKAPAVKKRAALLHLRGGYM